MTKCTFCADNIDAGLAPACVAACPMRALDYGEREVLEARYGTISSLYPLPDASLTDPSLVITPHQEAVQAQNELARVGNREEV